VVLYFLLLHENAESEPSARWLDELSPSFEVSIELFFSTWACSSSNLYGRPDVEFSAQTASDLDMV
jgi:hypothetical protein